MSIPKRTRQTLGAQSQRKARAEGSVEGWKKKFPHSPILHYEYIYGALLFNYSSPRRCACIMKYEAVRNFFRGMF